ncbi:MAG TPA: immunoglobulin domain-containing protein, partial [Verrucomicrobiae bacterium]|nr:immunoglobulin domain-containing protein [Verrucomicrobiae bacterium]
MAVFPDGSLLVANNGSSREPGYTPLIKFDAQGNRDLNFKPDNLPFYSNIDSIFALENGDAFLFGFTNSTDQAAIRINSLGKTVAFPFELDKSERISQIALGPKGTILAVLETRTSEGYIWFDSVARFLPAGKRDPGFHEPWVTDGWIYHLVMAPGDKMLAFGAIGSESLVDGDSSPSGFRLNADGTIDTSFRLRDSWDANVNLYVDNVAVDSIGRVYASAYVNQSGEGLANRIVRFGADGKFNAGFRLPPLDQLPDQMIPQPDGSVIVAGGFRHIGTSVQYGVARITAEGTLDEGFVFGNASAVIPQICAAPDGRIFVAFTSNAGGAGGYVGILDTSASAATLPVILQSPRDRTVLEGQSATFEVQTRSVPSARYQWQKDGVNVPGATNAMLAFSNLVFTATGSYTAIAQNISGAVTSAPVRLVVNARALTPGSLDTAFEFKATNGLFSSISVRAIVPQGDKLIVGGSFIMPDAGWSGIARLNSDGSPDSSFKVGSG